MGTFYYASQLVKDEMLLPVSQGTANYTEPNWNSFFFTIRKPVIAGTLTGKICEICKHCPECGANIGEATTIQTFKASEDGVFSFTDVVPKAVKCTSGYINIDTGEIALTWNDVHTEHHLIISYEYDADAHLNTKNHT
jgi:hypothetical protein